MHYVHTYVPEDVHANVLCVCMYISIYTHRYAYAELDKSRLRVLLEWLCWGTHLFGFQFGDPELLHAPLYHVWI